MNAVARTSITLVALLSVAVIVSAQGRTTAPGQAKNKGDNGRTSGGTGAAESVSSTASLSPSTSTTATAAPPASASGAVYYGSWLDDASVIPVRTVWVGLSSGYWRAEAGRQVDAPVLNVAAGIAPRVHVGANVPIYHVRDQSGAAASGLGNVYLYGKVVLFDPSLKRGVGLAVTPLLERAATDQERYSWALPVNVEVRLRRYRVYGSSGYFSRGSVFAQGAIEAPVGSHVALTANLGRSHASGTHQTDIGVGSIFFLTPATGVTFSVGRTFSPTETASRGTWLGGGISMLVPIR
jgi:hypothetical protein